MEQLPDDLQKKIDKDVHSFTHSHLLPHIAVRGVGESWAKLFWELREDFTALQTKYDNILARCQKMANVLEKIEHSPVPANEREYMSWFITCKNIAGGMLSEIEADKFMLEHPAEKEPVPRQGKRNLIVIHNNSNAFRNWVTEIQGYQISRLDHSTGVFLPPDVTQEFFQKEWEKYENANNLAKRKP